MKYGLSCKTTSDATDRSFSVLVTGLNGNKKNPLSSVTLMKDGRYTHPVNGNVITLGHEFITSFSETKESAIIDGEFKLTGLSFYSIAFGFTKNLITLLYEASGSPIAWTDVGNFALLSFRSLPEV
jgi:hypothetical protein